MTPENLWRLASRGMDLWLQPTDWRWLSALEVYGVLGVGQLVGLGLAPGSDLKLLMRLLFNNTVKKDHWRGRSRRVWKLVQAGHIQAHRFPGRPSIFTLAESGHEALERADLARLPGFRHRISESMVAHELTVAGAGLVLSEILGLEVLSARERVDWSGRGGRPPTDSRTVPDLWIAEDEQPKGFEIERGQKSKEEYRERWRTMRLTLPDNGLLLYVTTWPGGKRFILELARDFHADFVLVADIAEFLESRGRCEFVGHEPGRSLALRQRAFPNGSASSRRVPAADPPARPGFGGTASLAPANRLDCQGVPAGGGPAAGPCAAPSQRVRVGALTPPLARRGQSAPPPESGSPPLPLPLKSPSPSPEGDPWAAGRPLGSESPGTTGDTDR